MALSAGMEVVEVPSLLTLVAGSLASPSPVIGH